MNPTRFQRFRTNFLIFLSVLGPGIITANVNNDAGGIYTYSVAGAQFGYTLLWTLVPITVALVVVQEMVARMGVVTGKGLADLIREEYGFRTTFFLMALLLITNLGNTIAEFAGLASGMSIFGVSRYIAVPLGALLVWALVIKGTYRMVEKVFLVACVFYGAYLISGFLAHPDWKTAMSSAAVPSLRFDSAYLYMIIGLVGATVAPWMQFYLQSGVVEKGVKLEHYRQSRWDVIIGCIIADVVVFFVIVACAATIYVSGQRQIADAGDAALALAPLAGPFASTLFAFGLINASLFAACILPLATAYSVCEGLGLESGINKRVHEAPGFYSLYTGLIFLGAVAVVLLSESRQISIILLSQVANGIVLPFVLIFMLRLANREDLMGEYRNTRLFNVIAWITCVVMIALTLLLVISAFFPQYTPK
ncbi:MAG: Nramp family divalent metal transporter [Candidatus Tectomicrobia bacterium]|uniref:Nramp family divalent metal transporter n=1 Tax=Tectimicrobiota bacterium TaxID=2528274 RepID=A0A932GQ90_UNCTE|nr:Nramp family divalent metal transporter [Candidatus Tectomicrobia bacterium]